jgi:L-alanine-DL-glutamate epimerase-like enolase superfamily enzyme
VKITDVQYARLDLSLREPYTIAYETVSASTNIILRIKTDTGHEGWGCAAPDQEITGETPEEVIACIEQEAAPLLDGKPPFRIAQVQHLLRQRIPEARSFRAMVDMALYDLLARKAGIPLYQLLGGYRDRIETSITIGILPLEETLDKGRQFIQRGFRAIKLKGGLNLAEDIEKVHRLREVLGANAILRFDANQGYTVGEAIQFISDTQKARIEILEQPVSLAKEDELKQVTEHVPIPVMADESIRSLQDAYHLTRHGMIDMVNIKLMKVGGILEAQHINSVAKAGGMEVMVGCFDECELGISAGLHFALSRPNIEYADLDGHLDLLDDPFRGLFTLRDGFLYPGEAPGLGRIDYTM